MEKDPIRGKKIRWTYDDGPTAGKTFEHEFNQDGTLTYREVSNGAGGKPSDPKKYEFAKLSEDVWIVAYLGTSGYTLTATLDFDTGKVVSVASNEKSVLIQSGRFEETL